MTIKEIAKLCGVSIATVSKVLNKNDSDISNATRQKVLRIAKENNYRVNKLAQAMITKKTNSLGLLIPDITNFFFTDIAKGAEDAASLHNYSLFLCNTYDKLDKEMYYIHNLENMQVDGIIISGAYERDIKLEENMNIQTPIISIDRKVYYKTIGHVCTDNLKGSYLATKHLIDYGHKNIMYIGGPKNNDISISRFNGFKKALFENNISLCDSYYKFGSFTSDFGYKSIYTQTLSDDVTAIICGNDLIAFGVIYGLRKQGISVPNDISVVGYDDSFFASVFQPALTTVRQPSYDLGYKAVETIINHIENRNFKTNLELEQTLVIRESSIPRLLPL